MPRSYNELATELLGRMPELRLAYERETRWWGNEQPGQHIVFGDVLTPYVICLLESGTHQDVLRRAFEFLEELADDPDEEVRDVVAHSVIERLTDDEGWLQAAGKFMGEKTKGLVRRAGEVWGIPYAKTFR